MSLILTAAAAAPAIIKNLPNIIANIKQLFGNSKDPKAEFDAKINEAAKAAKTAEEKQFVESIRLQGLVAMREFYASQDPNNLPASVTRWGQPAIDAYRRNIEQARLEMGGTTTAFAGTPVNLDGPAGDKSTANKVGNFMDMFSKKPAEWGVTQWGVIAALLFIIKKIVK